MFVCRFWYCFDQFRPKLSCIVAAFIYNDERKRQRSGVTILVFTLLVLKQGEVGSRRREGFALAKLFSAFVFVCLTGGLSLKKPCLTWFLFLPVGFCFCKLVFAFVSVFVWCLVT